MAETLGKKAIGELLEIRPGWTLADDALSVSATLRFENFVAAWGFMTEISIEAEKTITILSGATCTTGWSSS